MTIPPGYLPHATSAEKLKQLFDSTAFQDRLSKCREKREPQKQNPWIDSQRKKELVRYFEGEDEEEIAVLAVYTDHPPTVKVQIIILQLYIDGELYVLSPLRQ